MSTRTTIKRVAIVVSVAVMVFALGNCQAPAAEPSLKEKADYNKSLAAVLGGISSVKGANANTLKTMGDYFHKLVTIRQLQEQIRQAKMANDMTATKNWYQKKKLYEDYCKSKPRKRLSVEKLRQLARAAAPARSASASIVRVSARVKWPHLLTAECFAAKRSQVEGLLAQRTAQNSGAGTRNCEQIQLAVAQMKSALRARIRQTTPMEYLAAKRFLDNLAFEARFVVGPTMEQVASR
jgi:hypothetical protein